MKRSTALVSSMALQAHALLAPAPPLLPHLAPAISLRFRRDERRESRISKTPNELRSKSLSQPGRRALEDQSGHQEWEILRGIFPFGNFFRVWVLAFGGF